MLPPLNAILALDGPGVFHNRDGAKATADLVRASAARYCFPVIDARGWMPAESFLDFDHLFPDLAEFETALAREIVDELRGR